MILWDVDPLDWKYRNADTVYANVMDQVGPGSIVLLHDVHPTTVAAVPRILKSLADRGYVFVTVSELFGGRVDGRKGLHGAVVIERPICPICRQL